MKKKLFLVGSLFALFYALASYLVFIKQEQIIFQPHYLPLDYKFNLSRSFSERFFVLDDDTTIHTIIFPPDLVCPGTRGLVIFLHGQGVTAEFAGHRSREITKRCHMLVAPDYPSVGKSRGPLSQKSLIQGLVRVYTELKAELSDPPLALFGQSLGTGIAAELALLTNPKAVILEAPYESLVNLSSERFPWLPVALLLKYPLRTGLALSKLSTPVFIIHGTSDQTIPFKNSLKLKEVYRPDLVLFTVEGGGHGGLEQSIEYSALLNSALGDVIEPLVNNS